MDWNTPAFVRRSAFLALAVFGVSLFLPWYRNLGVLQGQNEFVVFYAGATLIGPDQFNRERNREVQIAARGEYHQSLQFTRLPAYGLVLRPLRTLPYQTAYRIFRALSLAAVLAFVLLWRARDRWLVGLACCWSCPLATTFVSGHDSTFLLPVLALAFRLQAAFPALAGAILALGAIKFHLFILVPVALLAAQRWRMLAGFSASAALIFAACFVASGPNWIAPYATMIFDPVVSPRPWHMPNLHGLLFRLPLAVEITCAVVVAVVVWRIAAVSTALTGISVAIIGGILVSHHGYVIDLPLLIPALCAISAEYEFRSVRLLSAVLLQPFACLLTFAWFMTAVPLLLLAVLASMAVALRGPGGEEPIVREEPSLRHWGERAVRGSVQA